MITFVPMGNSCCGGEEYEAKSPRSISGGPPPPKVMTPAQDERREAARMAAEERARQGAVRGTQRIHPKKPPKNYENNTTSDYKGPDIADWN